MHDELISKEQLLNDYDREHVGKPGRARELIANAQPVEAEWILTWALGSIRPLRYKCSRCKKGKWTEEVAWLFDHCPKCGAKIRKGEKTRGGDKGK